MQTASMTYCMCLRVASSKLPTQSEVESLAAAHNQFGAVCVVQDEDLSLTLGELVETKRGIITVATEASALAGMLPFIYIEICTVIEYGPSRWLSIWNLMDLATYFLQVEQSFLHKYSLLGGYAAAMLQLDHCICLLHGIPDKLAGCGAWYWSLCPRSISLLPAGIKGVAMAGTIHLQHP